MEIFSREINALSRKEETVSFQRYFRVCETQPLHTSEPVTKVTKSVFEALPYPRRSVLEKEFMVYLDEKEEVKAFTKVLKQYNRDGRDSSGRAVGSGIYFYRLKAHTGVGRGDFVQIRRMVILK